MNTYFSLLAVVLPSAGFDVLLGLSWIVEAGKSQDVKQLWLIQGAKEYTLKSMTIPKSPKEVFSVVIYDSESCRVPAGGKAKSVLVSFNHGVHGGDDSAGASLGISNQRSGLPSIKYQRLSPALRDDEPYYVLYCDPKRPKVRL